MKGKTTIQRLDQLPHDCSSKILSFLDHVSVLRQRRVNRFFRRIASENAIWEPLCRQLWKDKIHVSKEAQDRLPKNAMEAYRLSIKDATRDYVTLPELCFNPQTKRGTIWSIRFKEAAGPDWTSFDPWFNHQPCRKMVFLEDGEVKMYVPRKQHSSAESSLHLGSMETHDHDAAIYTTHQRNTQIVPEGMELSDPVWRNQTPQHQGVLEEPPSPMSWRFVEQQPLDFPRRPLGSYIRLTVGGREVPTYVCRRSPTNNWGFVMESCWGVTASFELPPRPKQTRHRHRRRRLRWAHNLEGNEIFVRVEVEDSSEDERDEAGQAMSETLVSGRNRNNRGETRNEDLLVTEESFNVTIALQWREAFLYNSGATTLPEGDGALQEFQRIYERAMAD
jgi:hypothetical protein